MRPNFLAHTVILYKLHYTSAHSLHRYVISNRTYLYSHSCPTFNSPRLAVTFPSSSGKYIARHFSQKINDSSFLFLHSSYHCWLSVVHVRTCTLVADNVFLSQLYDTSVGLSNECPSISRRALFHFFKVARRARRTRCQLKLLEGIFPANASH